MLLAILALSQMLEPFAWHMQGYAIRHYRHEQAPAMLGRTIVRKGRKVIVNIADCDAWPDRIDDVTGDGKPELMITTWTGGAHASFSITILSLSPQPRCLITYWQGNQFDDEPHLQDLDRDGRKEIVTTYDGFAYRLNHGFSAPSIPLVFRFDGNVYREATARYPGLVRQYAQSTLEKIRASATPERSDLVGFLAAKMILGQEAAAWKLLRSLPAKAEVATLYNHRRWIREVVAARSHRARWPRLSQLPLPWNDIDGPRGPWDD